MILVKGVLKQPAMIWPFSTLVRVLTLLVAKFLTSCTLRKQLLKVTVCDV